MDRLLRAEVHEPTRAQIKALAKQSGSSMNQIRREFENIRRTQEVYVNSTYQVNVEKVDTPIGRLVWLSIKRRDKDSIHDWRDLQEIKNQLVGEENEGVELYPAESRKVDSANQYHLWVFEDPTKRYPFGYNERLVEDGTGELTKANNRQRKL